MTNVSIHLDLLIDDSSCSEKGPQLLNKTQLIDLLLYATEDNLDEYQAIEYVDDFFSLADPDGDGLVSKADFVAEYLRLTIFRLLRHCTNNFDDVSNGDGSIERQELSTLLRQHIGSGASSLVLDRIFTEIDANGDQVITLDELQSCYERFAQDSYHRHRGSSSSSGKRNCEGQYERNPLENDWHRGWIEKNAADNTLQWINEAGIVWKLHLDNKSDSSKMVLKTFPDCPYYDGSEESSFVFTYKANDPNQVEGFHFNGEFYSLVTLASDDVADSENTIHRNNKDQSRQSRAHVAKLMRNITKQLMNQPVSAYNYTDTCDDKSNTRWNNKKKEEKIELQILETAGFRSDQIYYFETGTDRDNRWLDCAITLDLAISTKFSLALGCGRQWNLYQDSDIDGKGSNRDSTQLLCDPSAPYYDWKGGQSIQFFFEGSDKSPPSHFMWKESRWDLVGTEKRVITPAMKLLRGLNVNQVTVDTVDFFLKARDLFVAQDYQTLLPLLEQHFLNYPIGGTSYTRGYIGKEGGQCWENPVSYTALRMMYEVCQFVNSNQLGNDLYANVINTCVLTVIIIGKSKGKAPTTKADWLNMNDPDNWPMYENTMCQQVIDNDFQAFRECMLFFNPFFTAMTLGKLKIEPRFLVLPDLEIEVQVNKKFCCPIDLNGPVTKALNEYDSSIIPTSDMFWITHPSHTPFDRDFREFDGVELITGGMSGLAGRPLFMSDDRWVYRRPAHMGNGQPWLSSERQSFFARWMIHEFFHWLFGVYPEFQLEVSPHQWFDLNTWPDDFDKGIEPDYYFEALHKRLQEASVPLHVKLIHHSPPTEIFSSLTIADVTGEYKLDAKSYSNEWHEGVISLADPSDDAETNQSADKIQFTWTNGAGRSWGLTADLANSQLITDADNPYHEHYPAFMLTPHKDSDGLYHPTLIGFRFAGNALFCKV